MNISSKIYIAGHTGLVGSALHRKLESDGYNNFVFTPFPQFDLRNPQIVADFFEKEKPEFVFLAAARVGGIVANNTYRAEFIFDNLMIQNNIINQSYVHGVAKLLFLGSSCIYPKNCPQPIKESYLLTDVLEYTNEPYAIAKIAGIKTIESYNLQYGTDFISVMPTNLYGVNDNFNLENSHVLPAMIRKFHLAKVLMDKNFEAIRKDLRKNPISSVSSDASEKELISALEQFGIRQDEVELWGTGSPRREFLHADDLADACVFLMKKLSFKDILQREYGVNNPMFPLTRPEIRNTHINIGTGTDQTISELAEFIKNEVVRYEGKLVWNAQKPDGTPRKLLDVSKLNAYGWKEKIDLESGVRRVYSDYCA